MNLSYLNKRPFMLFLEEEGGGGGGAAVAEPPATALMEDNAFLADMKLPSADIFGNNDAAPPAEQKQPETKPASPETPPAEQPQEKGKPGPKPAALLRDQLEKTKAELEEAREQLKRGDPRIAEFENAVKAKESEIEQARKEAADYRKQLALADPEVTKELKEMDSRYESEATSFYRSVHEIDHDAVRGLAGELANLDPRSPNYRTVRREFEDRVNMALIGDGASPGDPPHRKLGKTLDWIEKTLDFAIQRPQIQAKIEGSALDLQRRAREEGWTKEQKAVHERLAAAREVPEDLRSTQPYHPRVVLDAFAKSLSPEDAAKVEQGIPEFVELAVAGVRPRGEKDYAGMSPAQIKEAQAEEKSKYEMAREQLPTVLYNGLRSLRLLPLLMKENQRLREKVKEAADSQPPDPTAGGEQGRQSASDDINGFTLPAIPSRF